MIKIKMPQEIEIMAEGGRILAQILTELGEAVIPGIATQDIDRLARELILRYEVKAAFLGYNGFPAALCVSVNDEVVHGVPSKRILKEGDIVGLDMGVIYKGFYTDSAITIPVFGLDPSDRGSSISASGNRDDLGYDDWVERDPKSAKLIETAKHALNAGIKKAKIGNNVGAIGHEIQKIVESAGFNVVRDLAGHGIGRELHEDPSVPNFGKTSDGPELEEGMVIAIEPMIMAGDWRLKLAPDGQTYLTQDGSFSAHFEHTVAITKNGPQILTLL